MIAAEAPLHTTASLKPMPTSASKLSDSALWTSEAFHVKWADL